MRRALVVSGYAHDPFRVGSGQGSGESGEFGRVGAGMLSVRFTHREGTIRIFGAGYWRKGKRIYEKENQIHG
jgi:hypothetical protein